MRRSAGESSVGTQVTSFAVVHVQIRSSWDRPWKAAQWRGAHGSQASQRQWEKHQWKSTLRMATKARRANTSRGRRASTKARESTKASKRAVQSSRAAVVFAESGDTSSEIVATRTPSLRWKRKGLSSHQRTTMRAAAQTRVPPPPPGLRSFATSQATLGKISTLKDEHAHSGWLCAHATDVNDTRLRGILSSYWWALWQLSTCVGLSTSHMSS